MSKVKVKLTGWQAVVVLIVLAGLIGVRLMTFNDKKDDQALMKQIEVLLMSDYYPNEAAKLKVAYDSGDEDKLSKAAKAVTTAKLNVEAVQTSYPLFKLTEPKKVVVKVTYSLKDDSRTRDRKIKYYLFKHGSLGNWQYQYETSIVSYYLNFY